MSPAEASAEPLVSGPPRTHAASATIRARLRALAAWLGKWRKERVAAAHLARCNAHELRDIGLDRADLPWSEHRRAGGPEIFRLPY
jgi:uncharacterized protein YjiS (DUF1127 family)